MALDLMGNIRFAFYQHALRRSDRAANWINAPKVFRRAGVGFGRGGRDVIKIGDLSKGVFWAGMVQGLIQDIPTCQELVSRIVADALAIVRGRLAGMLV